ncbi:transcription factor [Theileria orientalis]|uniref:Transcription factor n=1 Tax=Theileria orientalis TaxID=68886 RepID=A0A976SIF9_THEOR|nr:transcription factor [Theileria orientalis]
MAHDDMFDDENDHLDKDDRDDEPSKDRIYDFIPKGMIKRRTFEGERPGLKLRACIRCRLIMTEDQFYENGCGNCTHLQMDGDRRRTLDCTSSNFSGFLSIMDPERSWSAKYNNLINLIPGCYAISVNGTLPESINDDLLD